ncbi:ABC-2 type transport system permease protein [Haloactinopolyspora alba]|uniref:ABC-2 type transport system permease protein n=1 Tax=Haloactinopolyspora alba TaxID=648780 RepID=A0A2P8EG03_9ACTN|nr:ABC transporter permease [Haloactinopolyspora alba]PSL08382.1 ABC-2 type transport system permease protein [Haloactinopolyspora alba]
MTAHVIWTEIKLLSREPLTMLVGLAFPTLLMVLLAGSFGNEPDPEMGGLRGTDFYVPVYASAAIAVMGFLGVPTHLAAYRERGVLRRFRAASVSAWTMVAAQVVMVAVLAAVGVGVMLTIGFTAFDLTAPSSAAGVAVGLVVGVLAFAGIGVFLGVVLPTARAAQGTGLLLFFGLFFVAGGGPPPYLLPDTVNTLADLTPMGSLVSAVSDPWHGDGWNVAALVAMGALAAVMGTLATRRLART